MRPVDKIKVALEEHGYEWSEYAMRGQCPVHEGNDKGFNLSVNEGDDGRALITCHSHGCNAQAVAMVLGLDPMELFASGPADGEVYVPPEKPKARVHESAQWCIRSLVTLTGFGEPSNVWEYTDASGDHVGSVIRWDLENRKEIRQISKVDGGWVAKGMTGLRPLFNLPEVLKAEFVVIVEGEKTADATSALGYTVTTPTQGSKAASKTDWSVLAGKSILLLPDNDDQGMDFVKSVISLLPRSCSVEVKQLVDAFDLPIGGDLADLNEVGEEALKDFIDNFPPSMTIAPTKENKEVRFSGRSAAELWDSIDEDIDWIVQDVISADQPTIFGAKQKALKTTLLSDLAVALATGTPWLGKFEIPRKRRVLFITGESSDKAAMKRIRRAMQARSFGREELGDYLRIETVNFPNLPCEEDCLAVRKVVQSMNIEVVIVDPLYMGLQGINASNLMEVGPALRRFMECCKPASMILAHHVKKTSNFDDAPNLEDLSQAGIAEFAGNYWMMGRLSEYTGDGNHELAIRHGGRDDQFGMYKMDFNEEFWSSEWMDLHEWRAAKKEETLATREEKALENKEKARERARENKEASYEKSEAAYTTKRGQIRERAEAQGLDTPFTCGSMCTNGSAKKTLERMLIDGYIAHADTPPGGNPRSTYYRFKE